MAQDLMKHKDYTILIDTSGCFSATRGNRTFSAYNLEELLKKIDRDASAVKGKRPKYTVPCTLLHQDAFISVDYVGIHAKSKEARFRHTLKSLRIGRGRKPVITSLDRYDMNDVVLRPMPNNVQNEYLAFKSEIRKLTAQCKALLDPYRYEEKLNHILHSVGRYQSSMADLIEAEAKLAKVLESEAPATTDTEVA